MSDKPIRALIDILEKTPNSWNGYGKARLARHSVHVAMAKYADADGSNVWASLASIAYTARVTTRTAQDVIDFLLAEKRLIERTASHPVYGTKIYDLVLPTLEEAEVATRERKEMLDRERTSTRQRVARFREKQARVTEHSALPNETVAEDSALPSADVTEDEALRNGTQRVTVTEHSAVVTEISAECNAQTAVDLSYYRSKTVQKTPSIQPSDKRAGWLDGRIASVLQKKLDSSVMTVTHDESRKLHRLANKYGTLPVLLAFYNFVERDRSICGLNFPVSLFIDEAERWIALVPLKAAENNHTESILATVERLASEAGVTDELLLLAELAFLESNLNDSGNYDVAMVEDYLMFGAPARLSPENGREVVCV